MIRHRFIELSSAVDRAVELVAGKVFVAAAWQADRSGAIAGTGAQKAGIVVPD